MEKTNGNSAVAVNLRIIAIYLALATIVCGLVVLIGWTIGSAALASLIPNFETVKPNAAFCFILTGISLVLLNISHFCKTHTNFSRLNLLIRFLATIILIFSILTAIEYITKIDLHIDQLFLFGRAQQLTQLYSSRIAIIATINFLFLGLGLIFATTALNKNKFLSQICVGLVGFISIASLIGFITNEPIFISIIRGYVLVAFAANLLFLFVVVSFFFSQPEIGFTANLLRKSPSGLLLRYLLPVYILLVLFVTFLIIFGIRQELFTATFAVVFFAIVKILIFVVIIFILSKEIDNTDIDLLTQLRNRNGMQEILQLEINRHERYKTKLSILFLDIDNFKNFNDEYGHKAGDKVLQHLAQIIRQELRVTDYAFRYGGEEFLVILPQTGVAGAQKIAERIRLNFKAAKCFPIGQKRCVHKTVSIGIAECKQNCAAKSLIDMADKAMYQAKLQGKDQVSVFK